MESISIYDGLVLTVISIGVVFIVLASIWGLIEIVSYFVNSSEPVKTVVENQEATEKLPENHQLIPNKNHRLAAEMMALILAAEDEPDKKYEIVESKRVK